MSWTWVTFFPICAWGSVIPLSPVGNVACPRWFQYLPLLRVLLSWWPGGEGLRCGSDGRVDLEVNDFNRFHHADIREHLSRGTLVWASKAPEALSWTWLTFHKPSSQLTHGEPRVRWCESETSCVRAGFNTCRSFDSCFCGCLVVKVCDAGRLHICCGVAQAPQALSWTWVTLHKPSFEFAHGEARFR